jgi:hypothetical protein
MLSLEEIPDYRDVRYVVSAIFPPETVKRVEEFMDAKTAEQGINIVGPMRPMQQLLTIDEALAYFQRLKETQDRIVAAKDAEKAGACGIGEQE